MQKTFIQKCRALDFNDNSCHIAEKWFWIRIVVTFKLLKPKAFVESGFFMGKRSKKISAQNNDFASKRCERPFTTSTLTCHRIQSILSGNKVTSLKSFS